MDFSNSFNTAAAGGPSAGEAGQEHTDGHSPAHSGPAEATGQTTSNHEAQTSTNQEAARSPKPAYSEPQGPEREEPDPAIINATQDRHFDELGRFYSEKHATQERMTRDFERRFGENERRLRAEIQERQNILNNSGPARLFWLKLTQQLPKNPEQDLAAKKRTFDEILGQKDAGWRAFRAEKDEQMSAIRARHAMERQAPGPKPQSQGPMRDFNRNDRQSRVRQSEMAAQTSSPRRYTVEQAKTRLADLERQRAKLQRNHNLPAPRSVAKAVAQKTQAQVAREIARLNDFIEAQETVDTGEDLEEDL